MDNPIGFVNTYPLDSKLSGGQRYPPFEQPSSELQVNHLSIVYCLSFN